MKKGLGIILIALGLLATFKACLDAHRATSVPYLMGTYLPGLVLLAIGVGVRQGDKRVAADEVENESVALASKAELGVIGGMVLMLLGNGVSQHDPTMLTIGGPVHWVDGY